MSNSRKMYVKGDSAGEPVLLCKDTVDFLVESGLLNADELAKISLCKETIKYLSSCGLLLKTGASQTPCVGNESDGYDTVFGFRAHGIVFDLPELCIAGEDISNPPIKIRCYEDSYDLYGAPSRPDY